MATTSLHTLNAAITDAVDASAEALAGFADDLRADLADKRRIQGVRAGIRAARDDVKAARDDLDCTDVSEFTHGGQAERVWGLWVWERETRHSLALMTRRLAQVDEAAEALEHGIREVVHVVRQGETLQGIAAARLGDWQEWPRIAEANGLVSGEPASGTELVIPPRR